MHCQLPIEMFVVAGQCVFAIICEVAQVHGNDSIHWPGELLGHLFSFHLSQYEPMPWGCLQLMEGLMEWVAWPCSRGGQLGAAEASVPAPFLVTAA